MKNKNKLWLSQVAANIPNDRPIIFWDTCALVDVARIPHSTKKFTLQDLEQYEQIAQWIEEGRVISVTSDVVSALFRRICSNGSRADKAQESNKRIHAISP